MARDPRARIANIGDYEYIVHPQYGPGAVREILYEDGTIERRFVHLRTAQEEQQQGELGPDVGYLLGEKVNPQVAAQWESRTRERAGKSAVEVEREQQIVAKGAKEAADEERLDNERRYNSTHPGPDGRAYWETHAERAQREQREAAEKRAQEDQEAQRAAERRAISAQESQNQIARGNQAISQGQLDLAREKEEREASKPTFLSQSGTENPYLVRFNPQTGMMEQMANPNYDAIKVEAERQRQLIATQIQARQLTLEEGKQQYAQWYDQNVKVPLALAQEARDRAAEQRAALDAEERRRQFAANFGLQKAELGQRAGQTMVNAEIALLPYRAGPTEAAEMSAAINSLGRGGSMSTDASAGINFTPGAFTFNAPDFKKIAAAAAKQALSGLTDYRPADGEYATADYSGVPSVNTSGAPGVPSGFGALDESINRLRNMYQYNGG